jgi:muramoyltetrapeptide carboxypeptidase
MDAMKLLRHLRPGDRVAVIAPAGPPAPERMALVEPLLARYGLRAKVYPSCLARHALHDFLAGDDALRLADLHAAFADDEVSAVFCARGGYGCTRLLDALDVDRIVARRKPFVGYSDITALHAALQARGEVSFHAPMPASDLVIEGAADDADALFALLMNPLGAGHMFAPALLEGAWQVGGRASGRLVGGNLSLIAALAGTRWALDARDAIVFIEDVSEALYRVDRLLTQLRQCGLLDAAAGFLLGSFTEDDDPVTVLREHFASMGKPVLAGWPAGHGRPNRALTLGAHVTLDAGAGTLTLNEAVLE